MCPRLCEASSLYQRCAIYFFHIIFKTGSTLGASLAGSNRKLQIPMLVFKTILNSNHLVLVHGVWQHFGNPCTVYRLDQRLHQTVRTTINHLHIFTEFFSMYSSVSCNQKRALDSGFIFIHGNRWPTAVRRLTKVSLWFFFTIAVNRLLLRSGMNKHFQLLII